MNKYQNSQQTLSSFIKQNSKLRDKGTNESDLKLIKAFTTTDARESPFKNFVDSAKERNPKKLIPKGAKDIVIKNLKHTKQTVLTKPIKNTGKLYKGNDQLDDIEKKKYSIGSKSASKTEASKSNYKKPVKWVTNKKVNFLGSFYFD